MHSLVILEAVIGGAVEFSLTVFQFRGFLLCPSHSFSMGGFMNIVNGRLPLAPGSPASYLKVHNIHVAEIKCLSYQRETSVWSLTL